VQNKKSKYGLVKKESATSNQAVPVRGLLSSGVTSLQYVDDYKKEQARKLRKNCTPAEKILWERLRGRQIDGIKFRRQ
jgi:hypothetical protein